MCKRKNIFAECKNTFTIFKYRNKYINMIACKQWTISKGAIIYHIENLNKKTFGPVNILFRL